MPNGKPRPSIEEFSKALAEKIAENLDKENDDWWKDTATCNCCSEWSIVDESQIAKEIERAMLELYG